MENETYLGIRIYRFYIKCTRCLQEISFKTDPQNTDYEIEAGAIRNFMALKLAEEQAKKDEEDLREEEANNPMKLLENRTEQSRNEIEVLESLEELRDLNRRQQSVDYEAMLQQYDNTETAAQREERLAKQDEEFIKTIKFGSNSKSALGKRIIVEEEIIETDDFKSEGASSSTKAEDPPVVKRTKIEISKPQPTKSKLVNLVRKKETPKVAPETQEKVAKPTPSGLSLLSAYSDDSNESE